MDNNCWLDEFWMIDANIINGVLRRFLTAPRNPAYLDLPQYTHLREENKFLKNIWYIIFEYSSVAII